MQVTELGNKESVIEITHDDVVCISHAIGAHKTVDIILWLSEESRERLGLSSGLVVSPYGYIETLLELLAYQANAKPKSKANRFVQAVKADLIACKEWLKNVFK